MCQHKKDVQAALRSQEERLRTEARAALRAEIKSEQRRAIDSHFAELEKVQQQHQKEKNEAVAAALHDEVARRIKAVDKEQEAMREARRHESALKSAARAHKAELEHAVAEARAACEAQAEPNGS